jgi:hypothetical protein
MVLTLLLQHRFIESSFLSKNATLIIKVCGVVTNHDAGVDVLANVIRCTTGDYLHSF